MEEKEGNISLESKIESLIRELRNFEINFNKFIKSEKRLKKKYELIEYGAKIANNEGNDLGQEIQISITNSIEQIELSETSKLSDIIASLFDYINTKYSNPPKNCKTYINLISNILSIIRMIENSNDILLKKIFLQKLVDLIDNRIKDLEGNSKSNLKAIKEHLSHIIEIIKQSDEYKEKERQYKKDIINLREELDKDRKNFEDFSKNNANPTSAKDQKIISNEPKARNTYRAKIKGVLSSEEYTKKIAKLRDLYYLLRLENTGKEYVNSNRNKLLNDIKKYIDTGKNFPEDKIKDFCDVLDIAGKFELSETIMEIIGFSRYGSEIPENSIRYYVEQKRKTLTDKTDDYNHIIRLYEHLSSILNQEYSETDYIEKFIRNTNLVRNSNSHPSDLHRRWIIRRHKKLYDIEESKRNKSKEEVEKFDKKISPISKRIFYINQGRMALSIKRLKKSIEDLPKSLSDENGTKYDINSISNDGKLEKTLIFIYYLSTPDSIDFYSYLIRILNISSIEVGKKKKYIGFLQNCIGDALFGVFSGTLYGIGIDYSKKFTINDSEEIEEILNDLNSDKYKALKIGKNSDEDKLVNNLLQEIFKIKLLKLIAEELLLPNEIIEMLARALEVYYKESGFNPSKLESLGEFLL